MPPRIFLDTNIQVYAAGREHPLRQPCIAVLTLIEGYPDAFFTDAEVFQELLHRYRAIRAWEPLGRASFDSFGDLMEGRVEPIYVEDVRWAAVLANEHPTLDARDLLHAAVMKRLGVTHIATTDRAFDRLEEVVRLDPADVETWRDELVEED